jgi:hypothetical protein
MHDALNPHTSKFMKFSFLMATLPSLQILGIELSQADMTSKSLTVLTAEYYLKVDKWLEAYFDDLQTPESWEKLYVHLVRILGDMANEDQGLRNTDKDAIAVGNIHVPNVNDILQVCRLLFQAMGSLRNAIVDGQHRMCAMVEMFCDMTIAILPRSIPPRQFDRGGSLHEIDRNGGQYRNILQAMASSKVTVRVLVPDNLKKDSIKYSNVRENSQAKKKPRVLADV